MMFNYLSKIFVTRLYPETKFSDKNLSKHAQNVNISIKYPPSNYKVEKYREI